MQTNQTSFLRTALVALAALPLVAHAAPGDDLPTDDPGPSSDPTIPKTPKPAPGTAKGFSTANVPPHGPDVPSFTFSDQRPRVVVLMHGVTPRVDEKPIVNTGKHARDYWGAQFIQGVMGVVGEAEMRVVTPQLSGELKVKTTTPHDWDPDKHKPMSSASELAPIVYPATKLDSKLFTQIENNSKEIKNVIQILTKPAKEPITAVMVAYRDGSKHLMPQTGQAIDQIYASYVMAYGHLKPENQPQLYLVGHSFGGIVARAILANPTGADLFGNKLTAEQRWRADFLRRRVVHVTTISAPHLGTPMGDVASDAAQAVRLGANATRDAIKSSKVLEALDLTDDIVDAIDSGMKTALAAVSGERDCLADLGRMDEYNRGILKEGTATRGLPNSAVPIYTIAGRNPGGMSFGFDRAPLIVSKIDRPYDFIDLLRGPKNEFGGENKLDVRKAREAFGLYVVAGVMHWAGYGKEGRKPWGTAPIPEADAIISPWRGQGPMSARPLNAPFSLDTLKMGAVIGGVVHAKPYQKGTDGETDNDGFLGWDSAHGLGLPGSNWYRLYDRKKYGGWQPWDNDNHGSIMFNVGVGAYLHNEMLRKAGPNVVAGSRLSLYPGQAAAPIESHSVKVELLEVHDVDNNLDTPGDPADFEVRVFIGDNHDRRTAPQNKRTVTTLPPVERAGFASSIIPIRIQVNEDDNQKDDNVVVTGRWGREELYLYYDARTGRIYGDETVEANSRFSVQGPFKSENRGFLKLRITGK